MLVTLVDIVNVTNCVFVMIAMRQTFLIVSISLFLKILSNTTYAIELIDKQAIMGTEVSVEIWVDNEVSGRVLVDKVMAEMRRIDKAMNPWDIHSRLYDINARAFQEPVSISDELCYLINKSLFYSRVSQGAFDISFASMAQFYDFRKGKKPTDKERATFRLAINYKLIQLLSSPNRIRFLDEKVKIDLGGIAKGYAVDQGIKILKEAGVTSAIVTAGGDSRVLGAKQGRPWVIAVKHPRDSTQQAVRLPLQDVAISTSGDYERYFIEQGKRHHHIINPVTAESANQLQSVTILAANAVDTDALSTTVFVLGVKKGLALVNGLAGVDAVLIDNKGLLHYSDDLLMAK
ncbi:MAG: thiamine biosynthesis lipoprotein [Pseudohongiellaceae bacterium]|jgi:thiamine biosynthesis lipoprotein